MTNIPGVFSKAGAAFNRLSDTSVPIQRELRDTSRWRWLKRRKLKKRLEQARRQYALGLCDADHAQGACPALKCIRRDTIAEDVDMLVAPKDKS